MEKLGKIETGLQFVNRDWSSALNNGITRAIFISGSLCEITQVDLLELCIAETLSIAEHFRERNLITRITEMLSALQKC